MTNEQLLQEIEDVLRTMPPREYLGNEETENYSWLGRAAAAIEAWNSSYSNRAGMYLADIQGTGVREYDQGVNKLLTLIHQARHDLRMKPTGPLAVAIGTLNVF